MADDQSRQSRKDRPWTGQEAPSALPQEGRGGGGGGGGGMPMHTHLPLIRQHSETSSWVRPVREVSSEMQGIRASTLRRHKLRSWCMLARLLTAPAANGWPPPSTLSECRRSSLLRPASRVSSITPALHMCVNFVSYVAKSILKDMKNTCTIHE